MTLAITSPPREAEAVTRALGLSWQVHNDPYGVGLDALAGLALRDNPKRAHLVVSKVLAKHVPARPGGVRAAGLLLAGLVHERLGGVTPTALSSRLLTDAGRSADVQALGTASLPGAPLVLGFCETATGLGHLVAEAFRDATYVHTTRHPDPAHPVLLGFDEEHSHAVAHHLQPLPAELLDRDAPVVLVDDELTTGTTALNTIEQLLRRRRRPRFVVATLLDLRTPDAREAFDARAATLGVPVDVVALLDGCLTLPDDALDRARPWQERLRAELPTMPARATPAHVSVPRHLPWPVEVPLTARHGLSPADRPAAAAAVTAVVERLGFEDTDTVLVLGTEECMAAAIGVAHALELRGPGSVLVQSTTRSPVLPDPRDGYAIRRALAFPCPTDAARDSFLYNVTPLDGPDVPYDHVVVVSDAPASALMPLAAAVQPWSRAPVVLVCPGGSS